MRTDGFGYHVAETGFLLQLCPGTSVPASGTTTSSPSLARVGWDRSTGPPPPPRVQQSDAFEVASEISRRRRCGTGHNQGHRCTRPTGHSWRNRSSHHIQPRSGPYPPGMLADGRRASGQTARSTLSCGRPTAPSARCNAHQPRHREGRAHRAATHRQAKGRSRPPRRCCRGTSGVSSLEWERCPRP